MPHNVTSTREKITNFSRRFNRSNNDYFSPRGSSIEETDGKQADALSPESGDSKETHLTPSPADGAAPSSNERNSLATNRTLSSQYQLRPPMKHRRYDSIHASSKSFVLPDLPWLCGTWHICASSLPMWRDKRNVRINYTRLVGDKLDDLVSYQNVGSGAVHELHGVDKPKKNGSYSWRGKGRLMVASSRWEILGWGGGGPKKVTNATPAAVEMAGPVDYSEQWVVTYYARTMFTEAGVDIYARKSTGLSADVLKKLKIAIYRLGGGGDSKGALASEFRRIARDVVDVRSDGQRKDLVEAKG